MGWLRVEGGRGKAQAPAIPRGMPAGWREAIVIRRNPGQGNACCALADKPAACKGIRTLAYNGGCEGRETRITWGHEWCASFLSAAYGPGTPEGFQPLAGG